MATAARPVPARWILVPAALCAAGAVLLASADLDPPLLLAVNRAAAQWLPAWLPSCLTVLGHGLVAVMLVAPFLGRAPGVTAAALMAVAPAAVFSRLGKWLFERPRPAALLDGAQLHVQGSALAGHNSFPSGHSITIFVVVGAVALGLLRARALAPAPRLALGLAASALLGVAVAASRLMVGAHWPSDTLGGAALGLLAGLLGDRAAQRWRWWERPAGATTLAAVVLACALVLPWVNTGYPMARPVQWAAALAGAACALRRLAAARPGAGALGAGP